MSTTRTTQTPDTCCATPEVFVVNGGTEHVCHNCHHRSQTDHTPTVSVWENQTR